MMTDDDRWPQQTDIWVSRASERLIILINKTLINQLFCVFHYFLSIMCHIVYQHQNQKEKNYKEQ